MGRTSPIGAILRSAGLPAVAIIAMGFFGYYAVLGPNGVMAYSEYKHQLAQRSAEFETLKKQRQALQNRVGLLAGKNGADPDMVDELLHKQLNVLDRNEVAVPLKKPR